MKISWIENKNRSKNFDLNTVLLDKSKTFRFKKGFIKKQNFNENSKFFIGYDEDTKINPNIFLVETNEIGINTFKLVCRKTGYTISAKSISDKLKLIPPIIFKIEEYNFTENLKGFKLSILNKEKEIKKEDIIFEEKKDKEKKEEIVIKSKKERKRKPINCEICGAEFIPKGYKSKVCENCENCEKENPKEKKEFIIKKSKYDVDYLESQQNIREIKNVEKQTDYKKKEFINPEKLDPHTGRLKNPTDPF